MLQLHCKVGVQLHDVSVPSDTGFQLVRMFGVQLLREAVIVLLYRWVGTQLLYHEDVVHLQHCVGGVQL